MVPLTILAPNYRPALVRPPPRPVYPATPCTLPLSLAGITTSRIGLCMPHVLCVDERVAFFRVRHVASTVTSAQKVAVSRNYYFLLGGQYTLCPAFTTWWSLSRLPALVSMLIIKLLLAI